MKPLLLAAVFLLAQIGTNPSQPTRKSSIEGVVLRSVSGDVVPNAKVTLTRLNVGGAAAGAPVAAPTPQAAPNPQGARGAAPVPASIPPGLTDGTGKFMFQDLDEGTYTLQVQANGYVSQYYGQRYPTGGGQPIHVTAGTPLNNLSINLIPAGNIGGRIHDRADQPLINVPVQLLRYAFNAQGQRTYQSMGSTRTNDHGDYRFYWVTPGRYYLMAGNIGSASDSELAMVESTLNSASNANLEANPVGYAYYPGTPDIGSAAVIDLQPGVDLNGLGMTLTPKPQTYRIRGRIVDSKTGKSPAVATVGALPQIPGANSNGQLLGSAAISSRSYDPASGTFDLRELLPGTYLVTATMQAAAVVGERGADGVARVQPGRSVGTATIVVSGSDVDGVLVTMVPAGTIGGRIRVDGTLPSGMTVDRLRLQLISPSAVSSSSGVSVASSAAPKADGTFQITNVQPGDYRIVLAAQGSPAYLKEARLDGVDAFATPLRVSGPSTGLEVVVGFGGGRVTGTLTSQRSQPVPVSQVVLVPDRQRERPEFYRVTTSSEMGVFNFANVPPGDYKVFSWEGAEPYSWFDPDLLARSEGKGHAVRVTDGATEMADIQIIPAGGAR